MINLFILRIVHVLFCNTDASFLLGLYAILSNEIRKWNYIPTPNLITHTYTFIKCRSVSVPQIYYVAVSDFKLLFLFLSFKK